jgi:hypothetical protein
MQKRPRTLPLPIFGTSTVAASVPCTQNYPKQFSNISRIYLRTFLAYVTASFQSLSQMSLACRPSSSATDKTPWPLVRKQTIPTERPPFVGQVSANFWGWCRVVSATDPPGHYFRFPRPEPLLFHWSSSSIILTRLSGPRSRPTNSQKIW